ncbi:hypothetical protein EV426DRAFT_674712 [Tirmania nivea]|nr:hypothetical protein EV426DRAFT_674712 [Tirmania nivea]
MPRVSNKRKLTQWYQRGLKGITEEMEAQELVTAALEDAILDGVAEGNDLVAGLEDDLLEELEYLADDDDHDHDQGSDNVGSVSSISTASSASTRTEEGESLDGEMGEIESAKCNVISAKCNVISTKCNVISAKCNVISAKCNVIPSPIRPSSH